MVYFCRFCRCFYFICGIIWEFNRFMLLVYVCFADKESIGCCLLDVLNIKYLFLHVLAQWYLIPLSSACMITFAVNCHVIKISKLLIFKNGF